MSRAYASHASPPARPPIPRPARPPAQHVAETRYRDSSRPPVRNRSTFGWGWGGRESRARPSLPVSIRYTRYGVGIRVKYLQFSFTLASSNSVPSALQTCVGFEWLMPQVHCQKTPKVGIQYFTKKIKKFNPFTSGKNWT